MEGRGCNLIVCWAQISTTFCQKWLTLSLSNALLQMPVLGLQQAVLASPLWRAYCPCPPAPPPLALLPCPVATRPSTASLSHSATRSPPLPAFSQPVPTTPMVQRGCEVTKGCCGPWLQLTSLYSPHCTARRWPAVGASVCRGRLGPRPPVSSTCRVWGGQGSAQPSMTPSIRRSPRLTACTAAVCPWRPSCLRWLDTLNWPAAPPALQRRQHRLGVSCARHHHGTRPSTTASDSWPTTLLPGTLSWGCHGNQQTQTPEDSWVSTASGMNTFKWLFLPYHNHHHHHGDHPHLEGQPKGVRQNGRIMWTGSAVNRTHIEAEYVKSGVMFFGIELHNCTLKGKEESIQWFGHTTERQSERERDRAREREKERERMLWGWV